MTGVRGPAESSKGKVLLSGRRRKTLPEDMSEQRHIGQLEQEEGWENRTGTVNNPAV